MIEAMNDLIAGNVYLITAVVSIAFAISSIAGTGRLLMKIQELQMENDRLAYNLKHAHKKPVYLPKYNNGGEK